MQDDSDIKSATDGDRPLGIGWTLPVRASNGGLFVSRGSGIHPRRIIDTWELIYVVDDTLSIAEDEMVFEVHSGEALLLRPGRTHWGTAPYPARLKFYWIHFTIDSASVATSYMACPRLGRVAHREHLIELFRRYLEEQEFRTETGLDWRAQADLLLMLMLTEVARPTALPNDSKHSVSTLASRAYIYIRTRCHESLNATEIATEVGCNPDYLNRIYRASYGRTLTESIHYERIRIARALLMDTAKNIDEIARESGFADPSYFRRIFKREHAMSPTAYRRLYGLVRVNTG